MNNRGSKYHRASMLLKPRVLGESGWDALEYPESMIRRFARQNAVRPTPAERHLHRVLNSLNGGILRGRFKVQYPINGKWIVDIFFPEIRLAIEVDGLIHETEIQKKRDYLKEKDCIKFDITIYRISNDVVFGDIDNLVNNLRDAWRIAASRKNKIIGRTFEDYIRNKSG